MDSVDAKNYESTTKTSATLNTNTSTESQIYISDSNQSNFTTKFNVVPSSEFTNAAFQQVLNFNPNLVNHQWNQVSASGFTARSGSHIIPGVPQLASTPGFLTGAGYHPFYHLPLTESSLLGSQRYPGCPLLPPGQAGTPLHSAAIVGDKHKLADALQDKNVNLEARDRWGRVALVYAVLGNHQECVELLLHAGSKPDALDSLKRTPLHFAAYKGYLGCIKSILTAVEKSTSQGEYSAGVWLAQDVRGVTPLHHAAVHNNHKCLQALLKYTVAGTLDTEDHKKRTPLHWAAAYGSQENVRLLIKNGANNLMPDQEGKTPLHWAVISQADGAKECVRTLIGAAPSNVNWQDFDGTTPLHIAVAEARKDMVDVILSVQNCNVNLTDNQFRTALHWACNRGVGGIAAHLMKRVANVDAVDIYGATPLHYAAKHNHADIVELLVRHGRVKDVSTQDGHSSLMWAAAQGSDSALAVMVRHGASLTQADPRGCTALHIAAGAGHVSTVRVLLHLQAPPNVCASDGRTPVHYAARAGHTQIVKVLAKVGASLDHRDNDGQCALHHAVLGGHLYLAQILIRAGTSVNVQDYYGRSPLHMAAYRGLSDIMFLLLENRGDVNARDFEGLSALHWAAEQGHLGAVNTLLDFHAYPNYTQSTHNRYTPYDCACLAEHLEVAQVLTEAGGISVTRIMEVAATKIQAAVRGYVTRCKLGFNSKPSIRKESKLNTDTQKSVKSPSQDFTQRKPDHCKKLNKDSDLPIISAVETTQTFIRKEDKGVSFKVGMSVRSCTTDHSPYNSVSGQRRSKALPTSIMRGARHKSTRNLELPGLYEFGNRHQRFPGSQEDYEDSDSGTETIDESTSRTSVSEELQWSGSVATAVITGGGVHSDSQQTHHDSAIDCTVKRDLTSAKVNHSNELRNFESRIDVRRVLSEEAVKQAEQKWKNKLATVTLQRARAPNGGRTEISHKLKSQSPTQSSPESEAVVFDSVN